MIHYPVVRASIGLAVGFLGGFAVIQAADRLGSHDGAATLDVVLGAPDLEAYCRREFDTLAPMLVTPDPLGWSCAGPIGRLWTSTGIAIDDVCRWQYQPSARARLVVVDDPLGWRCVADR